MKRRAVFLLHILCAIIGSALAGAFDQWAAIPFVLLSALWGWEAIEWADLAERRRDMIEEMMADPWRGNNDLVGEMLETPPRSRRAP